MSSRRFRTILLGASALVGAAALMASPATAQDARQFDFDMPAQPLTVALKTFGATADQQLIFSERLVQGREAPPLKGAYTPDQALAMLLAGSGLTADKTPGGVVTIRSAAQDPQSGNAAAGGAEVEELIVTAQKKEENIQDVPIAISAFSQKSLDAQKIEGGFDLLKAIPNVTFSKNNFTSYNFSIRGVGTKAVSATTDPGVAVAFNNTTIIQNRLFEQEYFDLERVEVLRGPQGTLYGRNATSGVINVISAKPDLNDFDGWLKGEVGNFHTKRLSAMVNVPLIEDKLAIRIAGALTDRQGYDYNSVTRNAVNGRDLWSGRVTIGFEPTERLRGDLIWERFHEDDNRSRTGKQLCHRDEGKETIGGVNVGAGAFVVIPESREALFSQGCKPGSLYDDAAFGTPNGLSYTFLLGLIGLSGQFQVGRSADGTTHTIVQQRDPYGGLMQSRNLREIASFRDPIYRAGADVVELNLEFDVTPSLAFYSQTAYAKDETYSFQDYNRFNTQRIFTDTSNLLDNNLIDPSPHRNMAPGGFYCDPQLGCSNTLAGFDIAQAKAEQFSHEFRLQSAYDGPVNFSVGVNYTKFRTLIDYYVMFNVLSAMSSIGIFNNEVGGEYDPTVCVSSGFDFLGFGGGPVPIDDPSATCPYIDPNPVESINGEGHNYFRSKNPYSLRSWAGFGEVYWNVRDDIKLTAGLRYTDDRKTTIPVPSQVLLSTGAQSGGAVSKGYPELPAIEQNWGEWTGRIGLDWRPDLTITDETMLYAFFSHGYKGGGANPPSPGFATPDDILTLGLANGVPEALIEAIVGSGFLPALNLTAVEYGRTFDAEFVNSYEVGAKNTLLSGALTLNLTGFYYDYKDYQVSQIRDRTAVNENFDAEIWGLEVETMFSPTRDLQIVANLGYLDTKVGDGETSIDIMNRTQGDPNYTLAKPWAQLPSNCVVPTPVAASWVSNNSNLIGYWEICGGLNALLGTLPAPTDPATGSPYRHEDYPELNGGAGIKADLSGNELPNAPHWTANIGAQYGMDILDGSWRATVRGDAYWQSQSWHRVYNLDPYDKLHGWYNLNLSVWFEKPDAGLKIELYAKNVLDDTPITDAFLNSDDTGLTTNVFTLDPHLIGLSIRKEF